MNNVIFRAKPYGTELPCVPLEFWKDVQAQCYDNTKSDILIIGEINGWYSRISIERVNDNTYRVFTPAADEYYTEETVTSRPVIIDEEKRIVTIGALIIQLKTPKGFKLFYGRSGHLADDGAELPPCVHTKCFDTADELSIYLQEEVLPWYSAEEGFFYRTEAIV